MSERDTPPETFVRYCRETYRPDPHLCVMGGHEFMVHPGVFDPTATSSSPCMVRGITVPDGGAILDMGCGVGVLGIVALHRGAASAVFADIDPNALANTRDNIARHGLEPRSEVLLSDMFSDIGQRRFDVVYCNPPCLYADDPMDPQALGEFAPLAQAYFDPGYAAFQRMLQAAPAHLQPGGCIQMMSTDGHPRVDRARIAALVTAAGMTMQTIHEEPNPTIGTDLVCELRLI